MKIEEITSLKNELIQSAKSLSTLSGRISAGKFLIEGSEAINWAITSGITIDYILLSKTSTLILENSGAVKIYYVSDGILRKVTDTKYLIPEVAVAGQSYTPANNDFIVVLDNIQDFGNLGTIIRTCHAFGIDKTISTKKDMDLYQRKTVDASRGRVYSTDLKTFKNPEAALNFLQSNNYQIITTSPRGSNIQSMISLSDKPIALVIGNETEGASEVFMQNADNIIQIPMHSHIESLNVGVAAGISIYELKLKQVMGMIENKIKTTLGREINVTSMLIQRVLDKRLKAVSELSSTQFIFMMVLKCDAIMTLDNIQRQFGVPDNDVDSFLTPLKNSRYISSKSEDTFEITEKGIEVIGKYWTIIENAEHEILRNFTEEESRTFRSLVNKMKDTCIDILNEQL
ncbi:MAG: hypothetical protein JW864_00575 [Spirochaetes bacterium]|nr:hypothetical protein [Spirochaetota bacterium]